MKSIMYLIIFTSANNITYYVQLHLMIFTSAYNIKYYAPSHIHYSSTIKKHNMFSGMHVAMPNGSLFKLKSSVMNTRTSHLANNDNNNTTMIFIMWISYNINTYRFTKDLNFFHKYSTTNTTVYSHSMCCLQQ